MIFPLDKGHFITGETAKQSAESLIQYEDTTTKDEELLIDTGKISRATSILKEYMKKGFALDDDPKAESSILFFKQVQNKMHWAAHKHTVAEVIYQRADADKDNMGLTSWTGKEIKRSDVEVAKNYLNEKEIDALNKIVTAYLDIAEVHALNQEPMYMKDWLETIDDYLKMTRRDILTTKGRVTHKQALEKAHGEYEKYRKRQEDFLSPVECHFLESIEKLRELEEKK